LADHNDLGAIGEQLAIDFLLKNGYTILEKNYRYLKAEVDVIAMKNNTLIAVEVKTRSSSYFGNPEEFVNKKKIKLLVTAIDYYVVKRNLDVNVRFDIIAITFEKNTHKLEHLEDAFLYF
jgi:putative endonuclease